MEPKEGQANPLSPDSDTDKQPTNEAAQQTGADTSGANQTGNIITPGSTANSAGQATQPFAAARQTPGEAPLTSARPGAEQQQPAAFTATSSVTQSGDIGAFGSPPGQQPYMPSPVAEQPKPNKKKLAGLLLLIALFAAGGIYALINRSPSTPEQIYNTSLERSGNQLNDLVIRATEEAQLEKIKNTQITATATFTSGEANFTGNLNVKLDNNSSDGKLNINFAEQGLAERMFSLKFLSELAKNQSIPDVYFNITGAKELGLGFFLGFLDEYEGQWIHVPGQIFDGLSQELAEGDPSARENVTYGEVASLIRAVSEVSNDRLFSSDPSKAVLENREFVGEEEQNGLKLNRYKVSVNVPNAVAYCQALTQQIVESTAYRKFTGTNTGSSEGEDQKIAEDCNREFDNDYYNKNPEFDLWIDTSSQLIYKVRIYDKNDTTKYWDIGQNYSGGDEINFFIDYIESEGDVRIDFDLDVNLDSFISTGSLAVSYSGDDKIEFKLDFEAKPINEEVNTTPPEDAINIEKILGSLGFPNGNVSTPNPSTNAVTKAKDTERVTDINNLHAKLEEYYNENGAYPQTFTAATFPGIDTESLADPTGVDYITTHPAVADAAAAEAVAAPANDTDGSSSYLYVAYPAGCTNDCTGYYLKTFIANPSASTPNPYTKIGLNNS